jgi:predicted metal-dependent phosphoesterase TrpH
MNNIAAGISQAAPAVGAAGLGWGWGFDKDWYSAVMRLELHCHSTCSDGSLPPEQIAARAGDFGVELFCLTDHDTMAGCERTAATLPGVRVLRGLELSCKHEGRTIHLLVWGVGEGPGRTQLEVQLTEQHRLRRERITAICDRLAELDIHLDPERILADAIGRIPGRPDVARALVQAGVCNSPRDAFDRFLSDEGPANVPVPGISLAEGLALGRATGARMGLAHPHTLKHFAVVKSLFAEFRDAGLEGIEAYYGSVSPTHAEGWLRLANELDLIVTAGSDFHGELGESKRPGIELPARHVARLREWFDGVAGIA